MPNQQNNETSQLSEMLLSQQTSIKSLSPIMQRKIAQDTALVVRSATASKALIKAQTEVAHTALTETALLVADVETLSHFSPDKQKYFEYILNEYTACVAQRIRMFGGQ